MSVRVDGGGCGGHRLPGAVQPVRRAPAGPRSTRRATPSTSRATASARTPSAPSRSRPISRFEVPPGFTGAVSGAAVTIMANGIGAAGRARPSPSRPCRTATAHRRSPLRGRRLRRRRGRDALRHLTSPGACRVVDGGEVGHVSRACPMARCTRSSSARSRGGRGAVWPEHRDRRGARRAELRAADGLHVRRRRRPDGHGAEARWMIRDTPDLGGDPAALQHGRVRRRTADERVRPRPRHAGAVRAPVVGPTTDWAPVTPARVRARTRCARRGRSPRARGRAARGGRAVLARPGGRPGRVHVRAPTGPATRRRGRLLVVDPATGFVPVGAVRVEGIDVTVDWSAQGWGLAPATADFGGSLHPRPPVTAPTP